MNEKIITNELINNFKIYLYEEERSGNTIEKYMRDIRFFREWLQGRNIDKSVVIEYKKELCEIFAVKSVNSMLSERSRFGRDNRSVNIDSKIADSIMEYFLSLAAAMETVDN